MRLLRSLVLLLALAFPATSYALQPDEILKDPALETRARALSAGLRCLVCQNQSIDDSAAPLARDLRLVVRERLQAGDDDKEIMRYVVARYGDFVLLSPPVNSRTLLLWSSPGVLLAMGIGWLVISARRRRSLAQTPPLSEAERRALEKALAEGK